MVDYSGLELVKQESCKLTYATFLQNVVVCYDKVSNELVLNNPYFYETLYDSGTKTLYNTHFSIRKVTLVSHYDSQYIVTLDEEATGLELILYADTYSRKSIIAYKHLLTCDSVECYDFGLDSHGNQIEYPYCKELTSKQTGNRVWPCLGAGRELVLNSVNQVNINDECFYTYCYDFSNTLDREVNYCEKVIYQGNDIWPCWDINTDYSSSDGFWVEGNHPVGVFKLFDQDTYIVTDPQYITTDCPPGQVCTKSMGCVEGNLFGTSCEAATNSMTIYEVPLIEGSYGSIYGSIGGYDYFKIETNGNVFGNFIDNPGGSTSHRVSIRLFNLFDIVTLNTYKEGSGVQRTVDLISFIYHRYFEGTQTSFTVSGGELSESELLEILPGLDNTTFDWLKVMPQQHGSSITYRAPCKYKVITTSITNGDMSLVTNYTYANNVISTIEHTGIDTTGLQADYDIFCEKAKWLLSSESYVYAVYQGYLDPNTPINY